MQSIIETAGSLNLSEFDFFLKQNLLKFLSLLFLNHLTLKIESIISCKII